MELFKSPDHALLFAYRFSDQQYALSPVAKMMKTGIVGAGKGLVALDGAGQAGTIKQKVERLTALQRACIVARYSARYQDCPCCGNQKPLDEYKEAIATLSEWAMQFLSGGLSVRKVRYAIVQEYFERTKSIGKIADMVKVPRRTAYDQKQKIWTQLMDLDKQARTEIDALLADLCGEISG